jgi:hypothetical protein
MDKINDGGPAFPLAADLGTEDQPVVVTHVGMSLRDYLAAKAMQGMCAQANLLGTKLSEMAGVAYRIADAMLEARK